MSSLIDLSRSDVRQDKVFEYLVRLCCIVAFKHNRRKLTSSATKAILLMPTFSGRPVIYEALSGRIFSLCTSLLPLWINYFKNVSSFLDFSCSPDELHTSSVTNLNETEAEVYFIIEGKMGDKGIANDTSSLCTQQTGLPETTSS